MNTEFIKTAIKSLKKNKLRSLLTALGVIVGIGSVVAMVSIGEGSKAQIEAQIASLGSNLVMVLSGSITQGGVRTGTGSATTLVESDYLAIKKEITNIRGISPMVRYIAQVVYGNLNWSTLVAGVSPEYLDVKQWDLLSGEALSQQDIDSAAKVAILGKTVAENLFGDLNPVGSIIRVKKIPFRVIGVLASKGQSLSGQDQDDVILIPYSTAQKKIKGVTYFDSLMLAGEERDDLNGIIKDLTLILRQRHHIQPGADDDFTIRNLTEITEASQSAAKELTLLLGSIASISLIVGGIGIMNIMLVSVKERTKEIGLRMAVGAKEKDILIQFLSEAVILSLSGGLIGIAAGITVSEIFSLLTSRPVLISVTSILLAFVFSFIVGIFFGLQPAIKASKLNPIEALRYE